MGPPIDASAVERVPRHVWHVSQTPSAGVPTQGKAVQGYSTRAPAAQYVVTVAGDGYLRSRTPQSAAQSAVHTIYTLRIGATIYTRL